MFTITAKALTPLYLGGDPEAGNTTTGLDHVPGSVLRGALAARWIRDHGTPNQVDSELRQQFQSLFDADLAYRALRPRHSILVPVSVRRCKYDQGCAGSVDGLHATGVSDICPNCGGALDDGGKGSLTGGPAMIDRTMVQLTAKGTPEDEKLFSRMGLPRGVELVGDVVDLQPGTGNTDAADWLGKLDGELLWLGGRRTAAGRVRLKISQRRETDVAEREDETLALTLLAPAILVDDAGRASLEFPVHRIEQHLGVMFDAEHPPMDPARQDRWLARRVGPSQTVRARDWGW